ncbi:branched-chain amino acid transporter permease [Granulicatella seriolae]|uniref:AzlD domain-containing protein n=1 Tax=Granulicatella seriolae TaxID=2967226 RepID=A0ABT1WLQ0_9LACT|nr:AzlD domain-containing protein [Granulicatella seriolae]
MTSFYVYSALIISGLITFGIRATPFLLFSKMKKLPLALEYLSYTLPMAIMVILVIYSLKEMNFTTSPYGLPEIICVLLVIALHVWKKNTLLSIFLPTIIYMVLVQIF